MDIASGTFTAETGGLYTITFSGTAHVHENESVKLFILHNGSQLKESYAQSSCSTECGYTADTFSRTVVSIYIFEPTDMSNTVWTKKCFVQIQ